MRTTLSLDDDVLQLVKAYAEGRAQSLGQAVSELVRKGLSLPTPTRVRNGLVVFDITPDEPPLTVERVKQLENETK